MSISFKCPACGQLLTAPAKYAGKTGRCKHCGTVIQIEAPAGSAPSNETASNTKRTNKSIEVACPNCKKRFNVEYEGEVPAGGTLVACDFCGSEKRLSAFQKELGRQVQQAEQERLDAEENKRRKETRTTPSGEQRAPGGVSSGSHEESVPRQPVGEFLSQGVRPNEPVSYASRKQVVPIACATCGRGGLVRKKKYRLSGPSIVIGYILLIPSIIGMLVSFLMFIGTGIAATDAKKSLENRNKTTLEQARVPSQIVQKVIGLETVEQSELASLSSEQRRAVTHAQASMSGGTAGTAIGGVFAGGVSVCTGVAFFIFGLLGWLLVMRKWVLQCDQCGATVAAS